MLNLIAVCFASRTIPECYKLRIGRGHFPLLCCARVSRHISVVFFCIFHKYKKIQSISALKKHSKSQLLINTESNIFGFIVYPPCLSSDFPIMLFRILANLFIDIFSKDNVLINSIIKPSIAFKYQINIIVIIFFSIKQIRLTLFYICINPQIHILFIYCEQIFIAIKFFPIRE